jgi:hypothetical protein
VRSDQWQSSQCSEPLTAEICHCTHNPRIGRSVDESSATRSGGRDLADFFKSTGWALLVKVTPNSPTSCLLGAGS